MNHVSCIILYRNWGISSSTDDNIVRRFRESGEVTACKRKGRKPIFSACDLQETVLEWVEELRWEKKVFCRHLVASVGNDNPLSGGVNYLQLFTFHSRAQSLPAAKCWVSLYRQLHTQYSKLYSVVQRTNGPYELCAWSMHNIIHRLL